MLGLNHNDESGEVQKVVLRDCNNENEKVAAVLKIVFFFSFHC